VGSALNKFEDDRQIYHIWGYHCWGILWTHWQAAEDKKKDVKQKFEARVKKEQAEKKTKQKVKRQQEETCSEEETEPSLQADNEEDEEVEQGQLAIEDTMWAAIAADPISLLVQWQVRHFQSQAQSSGGIIRHDMCVWGHMHRNTSMLAITLTTTLPHTKTKNKTAHRMHTIPMPQPTIGPPQDHLMPPYAQHKPTTSPP
jgi:hypothetical protein